jgi:triacylglycerol lipase
VSIYSRRDGIVDWRARLNPTGRHVEVMSSHCGMSADGVTLHVVVRSLERFRSPDMRGSDAAALPEAA